VVLPASTATEIWDASGLPLSALDQDTVMTAENLVDAALAGLDKGEAITWSTLADASLWHNYDAARSMLFRRHPDEQAGCTLQRRMTHRSGSASRFGFGQTRNSVDVAVSFA
jgi:short-subunit dehydrogenase